MGLLDRIANALTLQPMPLQERSWDFPDLQTQIEAIRRTHDLERPWRAAGIKEAMGVPAVFRAVTKIANITGSLTLRGYRNGEAMPDDQRPRLMVRPNPLTTPREFFRQTAWDMATRGEAWWWIAARDIDDSAISLIPVNPVEVIVTEDSRDRRFPRIEWRGQEMRNRDMIQVVLTRPSGSLRGEGPLQACGAAISVAVESQEWAANFYASGGYPTYIVRSAIPLDENEITSLRNQWINGLPNMPKFVDPGIEDVKEFGVNGQGAQMLEARLHNNGEVATMFGMDGSMLNYSAPGSSLTYQNIGQKFDAFVRECLLPDYLEPMEQAMGDLMPRSIVSRFNVEALLRADIQTRYTVYGLGIDKGILSVEEARAKEGLTAGDIENAPIPFSPPQAFPGPIERSLPQPVRCDGKRLRQGRLVACGKLLAEAGPFHGTCPRCKKSYEMAA